MATGRKKVCILTDTEKKVVKSVLASKTSKMFDMLAAYPDEANNPVYYIVDRNGDAIPYTGRVVYRQGSEDAWALSEKTLEEMAEFYNIIQNHKHWRNDKC